MFCNVTTGLGAWAVHTFKYAHWVEGERGPPPWSRVLDPVGVYSAVRCEQGLDSISPLE